MKKIIIICLSLITLLTSIYKGIFKKDIIRKKEYYTKLLKPFIVAYTKNTNISSIKFTKQIIRNNTLEDDIIPKYIHYLIRKNKSDDLKKVLIYDYCEHYDNSENQLMTIVTIIQKTLVYIFFILSLLSLFSSAYFLYNLGIISVDFLDIISLDNNTNITDILKNLLLSFFLTFFSIKCCLFFNLDDYTLKESKIKFLIKHKVRMYNRRNSNYFIYEYSS